MADILVPIAISSQLDDTGEERIHAAQFTPTIRTPYIELNYVYALIAGSSNLLRSTDGGLTWPDLVDSGGSASALSALFLDGTGNRLTRDQAISGRTSTDGDNFVTITGSLSGTGFPTWHLYTGTEWLRRSAGGMRASSDGIDYSVRTIPSLGTADNSYNSFAKLNNNIIFMYTVGSTGNLCYSTDNGATWASFVLGLSTQLVATANRFLAFVGAAGRVDMSTSGASGTWTSSYSTLPSASSSVRLAAYSPTLGRVVVQAGTGSFWRSDDEGDTWTGPYFPLPVSILDAVNVRGMIFAHNRFIASIRTNTNLSKIYTSDDGITWVERYSTAADYVGILADFEVA